MKMKNSLYGYVHRGYNVTKRVDIDKQGAVASVHRSVNVDYSIRVQIQFIGTSDQLCLLSEDNGFEDAQ